jgi:hypothetical protein
LRLGPVVGLAALLGTAGLVLAPATPAGAAATDKYVGTGQIKTLTPGCQHPTYPTIQQAINAAVSNARIFVCPGTYTEQLTVAGKNVNLIGISTANTIIRAPAVLAPDADGKNNIVEIGSLTGAGGPVKVTMRMLTVSGPGPGPCGTIDSGIAVVGGSMLNIKASAIADVGDNPLGGCQNGEGIRVGTQRYITNDPQTGHLMANGLTVSDYQKNGIVVAGAGSVGILRTNTISTANPNIGSNGIEVIDGAMARIFYNHISGNECNIVTTCGPNFTSQAQSSGILVSAAGSVLVADNTITNNDEGVYTDTGIAMRYNNVSNNRYEGVFVDTGETTTLFTSAHDTMNADGNYGVYVGSSTGSTAGEHARFLADVAGGNTVDDFLWDGYGMLRTSTDTCGSAAPTHTAWHC